MLASHFFDYCNFCSNLWNWESVSLFAFLQDCFSYSESFVVAYDFYDHFSSSLKICLGTWEFIDCLYHLGLYGYHHNYASSSWMWGIGLLICVFFNVFHQCFLVFSVVVFNLCNSLYSKHFISIKADGNYFRGYICHFLSSSFRWFNINVPNGTKIP